MINTIEFQKIKYENYYPTRKGMSSNNFTPMISGSQVGLLQRDDLVALHSGLVAKGYGATINVGPCVCIKSQK